MAKHSIARKRQRNRNKVSGNALIAAGLILVVVAGWLVWNARQNTSSAPAIELTGTVGIQLGEVAPDFSAPTLSGDIFTLTAQRGKPTIVFFMAYWCGTCIPEGRALAQLKQEYGAQLNIIALDIDPSSTPEGLAQFKQAAGNGDFAWGFDIDQQITQTYQVRSLDTTLIIGPEGHILYRDEFPSPYQTLKSALAELGL